MDSIFNKSISENKGIGIDITNLCQLKCYGCYYRENLAGKDFPIKHFDLQRIKQLFEEAKKIGFKEVYLLGGEPTLHPDFHEILASASEAFSTVTVVTNSIMLTNEDLCKYIASFKNTVLVTKRFTLDNDECEKEISQKLTGVQNYSITKAFALIEKYFTPDRVSLQYTISKPAVDSEQIFKIFRYAREKKYTPIMECLRSSEIFKRGNIEDLSLEELANVYKKFEAIDKELKIVNITPSFVSPGYATVCHAVETGIHITVDGNVQPCVGIEYSYGNILEKSLNKVLANPARKLFTKDYSKRITGACRSCNNFEICTGGCRAEVFYNDKCLTSSSKYCPERLNIKVEDGILSKCDDCDFSKYNFNCAKHE